MCCTIWIWKRGARNSCEAWSEPSLDDSLDKRLSSRDVIQGCCPQCMPQAAQFRLRWVPIGAKIDSAARALKGSKNGHVLRLVAGHTHF
jgi:hypothetical protein